MRLPEVLDLLLRWFHVIAGIMWIGNSLLFNWLDRNLEKKPGIEGEIWLLHSGAFYQVEKKFLEPGQMPARVHWFMWQNFSTWASGILLLVVVYFLGSSAWLVDPGAGHVAFSTAVCAAVGTLVGGWVFYDVLCRALLRDHPVVVAVVGFAALVAIAWGLAQVMTPRAAYIHVGVLIGTVMTGNVWTVIVPSQRELVAATREGRPQERAIGMRAKQRSIHNNYLTFPLIFVMISNHFPSLYAHRLNWAILTALMIGGALVRHFMNIRFGFRHWRPALVASVVVSLGAALVLASRPARSAAAEAAAAAGPPVPFEEAHAIIALRCVACHSATPSDPLFPAAPDGLTFDQPAQIHAVADRIRTRVETHTMPFRNRTAMTEAERQKLIRWAAQRGQAPTSN
jgi:uncharacterized membrane protein